MPQYALAVLAGALLAFYGNQLQDSFWSAYLPLLLLLARYSPRYRCLCLAAASLLWSSTMLYWQLDHRLHIDFDNRVVRLSAQVADLPRVGDGRVSLMLEKVNIEGYSDAMPRNIRLNWYQPEEVPQVGARWQFEARLRQPRGRLNSAGFDYEAWQFVHGIDANGYVVNSSANRQLQPAPSWSINVLRARLAANIDTACADCRHAGLVKALALGYRGDIDAGARAALQATGTAHLLAISGLHIGMVAVLCYALGQGLWRSGGYRTGMNRSEFAALLALVGAGAYAALAGFSLPTLRALIMLAVVLLGQCLHHRVNLLQSLSLAFIVIMVLDPLAVGAASLWLSFGALLVIAFAQFRFAQGLSGWRQMVVLRGYFVLLFAPPGVLIFGQLNVAGLPANLVAIPALSALILPTVLAACAASILPSPLGAALFRCADWLLVRLLEYLDLLLSLGLHARQASAYPALLVVAALSLLILLLMPRLPAVRPAALVGLLVWVCWLPPRLAPGEFELRVLDVGMGSSMLLRTRHYSLVYDFGPGREGVYSAADQALIPVMQRLGIGTADLLIVSHVDQDHSGGLFSLRERYNSSQLLSGTPHELRARFALPHRVRSCHDFPAWRWDGVDFRFLVGGKRWPGTNNRSCILLVRGHHRLLIPGDIEIAVERQLVKRHGDALAADVLLIPHHGSKTSSSAAFIDRVSPQAAIFTLGRNNRWKFPHADVEERYRTRGTTLYRSDRDGEILVYSSADSLRVSALRDPPRRLWRRW